MENQNINPEEMLVENESLAVIERKTALFISEPGAAERYLSAMQEFRKILPRATRPTDWVLFGDPNDKEKCGVFLQEYSASQISRMLQTKFGYTIKIQQPKYVSYPDSPIPFGIEKVVDGVAHIEVIVEGGVEITDDATGATEIIRPIFGSAGTHDAFFGKRHGEIIDPRSIPLANLLKKAVANYRGNCYREVWGLKGFTLADLERCGLDIKHVHDSMRRPSGTGASAEEKDARQELWQRILRVHDDKPELARKWLKSMTSYPAKPGKYPASEGYEDINRLYFKKKDGSESTAYRKILDALDKLEKSKGMAAEETQDSVDTTKSQGAAGHGKKKLEYISRLSACKTDEQVMSLEQEISKDQALSKDDMEDLEGKISRKFDEFVAKRGSGKKS